jgi:hypothetical protein
MIRPPQGLFGFRQPQFERIRGDLVDYESVAKDAYGRARTTAIGPATSRSVLTELTTIAAAGAGAPRRGARGLARAVPGRRLASGVTTDLAIVGYSRRISPFGNGTLAVYAPL